MTDDSTKLPPGSAFSAVPTAPPADLSTALATQDAVAVALALRSYGALVPLLPVDGPPQVRVFRRGDSDKYMFLIFSSEDTYKTMVPDEDERPVASYDREALLDFLTQNQGVLESVWFDVAGPNAMQAAPADVIEALAIPRPQ